MTQSKLTKKNFEKIAEIIKNNPDNIEIGMTLYTVKGAKKEISKKMADYFATLNPDFNRDKFLSQCGVDVK